MRLNNLLLIKLCFVFSLFIPSSVHADIKYVKEFNQENVKAFTDKTIMKAQRILSIPGAAVAIVKGDSMVYSKAYGLSDFKNNIYADASTTQFAVGSVSKVLTITALLKLVEQGKVDLDDDVAQLLEFDELSQDGPAISVNQLISHSAGFEESFLGSTAVTNDSENLALADYIKAHSEQRVRENGKQIVYSNYGINLIGAIIEKVSGMPFELYMQNNILHPLGMMSSSFLSAKVPRSGDPIKAVAHFWNGKKYVDNRDYYLPKGQYPAAGLLTTAEDMTRFIQLQLNGEIASTLNFLKRESLNLMRTELMTNHPQLDGVTYGFWKNRVNGYQVFEQDGVLNGFVSRISIFPELDLGIFITTNANSGYTLTTEFEQKLLAEFFDKDFVVSSVETEKNIVQYAGRYQMAWGNHSTIESLTRSTMNVVANKNYLQAWIGFEQANWLPQGDGVFAHELTGERIAFQLNDQNEMQLLTHDMVFTRIGFLANSNNFILFVIIGLLFSSIVLLTSLVQIIMEKVEKKGSTNFYSVSNMIAGSWSIFAGCFVYSIMSASGSLVATVYADFPDAATIIGQVLMLFIVLALILQLINVKQFCVDFSGYPKTRAWLLSYHLFILTMVIWSMKFNLIGFQF
jgi:CubicO group peptidase (beta-lactamase class C family)